MSSQVHTTCVPFTPRAFRSHHVRSAHTTCVPLTPCAFRSHHVRSVHTTCVLFTPRAFCSHHMHSVHTMCVLFTPRAFHSHHVHEARFTLVRVSSHRFHLARFTQDAFRSQDKVLTGGVRIYALGQVHTRCVRLGSHQFTQKAFGQDFTRRIRPGLHLRHVSCTEAQGIAVDTAS